MGETFRKDRREVGREETGGRKETGKRKGGGERSTGAKKRRGAAGWARYYCYCATAVLRVSCLTIHPLVLFFILNSSLWIIEFVVYTRWFVSLVKL